VTASDEASPIRAIRKLVRAIEENEAAGWNQELAWCLGFRKIILESDSLLVVSLIGKKVDKMDAIYAMISRARLLVLSRN